MSNQQKFSSDGVSGLCNAASLQQGRNLVVVVVWAY